MLPSLSGNGEDERTNICTAEPSSRCDEPSEKEGHVITTRDAVLSGYHEFCSETETENTRVRWTVAHPECARGERDHAAPETGLLALRRDPLVHALAQPYIGLHVP